MPLVSINGLVCITQKRVYFQPAHATFLEKPLVNLKIDKISQLFKRRYTLRDVAIEVVSNDLAKNKTKTMYLVFDSTELRDQAYDVIFRQLPDKEGCMTTDKDITEFTSKWCKGELSNFEYLMICNSYAQRTFNDLTQYPVMPWVIKDYQSDLLDLQNLETYRDLTKNIGSIGNPKRLNDLKERFEQAPDENTKFLFGSHYSAPGYVIGFHVRDKPQWMIKFQSGRFDKADRLFKDIKDEWDQAMNDRTNVKELIPEFYDPKKSQFLINSFKIDLGKRQNGDVIDDV